MKRFLPPEDGFTVIEMLVTIVIIGILAGIVVFSPKTFLVTARDQERGDDTSSIARQLEQAYSSQGLGYPGYPSTVEMTADITGDTRTMASLRPEAFQAPAGAANSVVAATSTSSTTPAGAGTPTLAQYVYQPLTASGTLCTSSPSSGAPCVSFYLYYRNEASNSIRFIKSMHQQ